MTDQPTPETDAEMFLRAPSVNPAYVSYEFARSMEIQRNAARAERDALRAALSEYGEHQGVCPKKYHGIKDSRPCTCGLDAAIATSAK